MRKYLIGIVAALIGATAISSSVASADVVDLRIESSVTPAKGDKKVRRGASTRFVSIDSHAGDLLGQGGCLSGNSPACYAYPPSVASVVTFPKSLRFDPGNLPNCNLAAILGKDSAGAKAACPGSIVGSGANVNRTLSGATLNGVITVFNGAPSGGFPTMYFHVDIAGVTTKPILNGVVQGNVLTVQIPPVPGVVIERFETTIDKIVSKKTRNPKSGKVRKTFYLMGNCSIPNYTVREDVIYQNGKVLTATVPGKCKQTKSKQGKK